jgi:hypothetical protein
MELGQVRAEIIAKGLKPITLAVLGVLVVTASLNLAWEHQVILTPMVKLADYYDFAERAPLMYRILPALLRHLVLWGRPNVATGLNEPLESYDSIFQLILDTISLVIAFVFMAKIARQLNPQVPVAIIFSFAGAAILMIVVFGYFMVPNKAFFYPYDFPDLCIATIIFYICIQGGTAAEILLPATVFVATLNKETAVFYSGLYLVFSIERHRNWKRVTIVLFASAAAFILARTTVLLLIRKLGQGSTVGGPQFETQIAYTLQQFRNPLFLFALLNICSYLYLPVWAIRKRLDRTDMLILAMVVLWIIIMSMVGIFRQLRLFVPASVFLFVILARHLTETLRAFVPGVARALDEIHREGDSLDGRPH